MINSPLMSIESLGHHWLVWCWPRNGGAELSKPIRCFCFLCSVICTKFKEFCNIPSKKNVGTRINYLVPQFGQLTR